MGYSPVQRSPHVVKVHLLPREPRLKVPANTCNTRRRILVDNPAEVYPFCPSFRGSRSENSEPTIG